MISINQAIEIMKKNIPDRKAGVISTSDSLGYVLAEKTLATISSPRYTNSAVDGFAVSWEDVEKPSCYLLPEKAAQVFRLEKKIVPHSAYRISNGAIVPEELDSVVPKEYKT